jgi:hypothetical protein
MRGRGRRAGAERREGVCGGGAGAGGDAGPAAQGPGFWRGIGARASMAGKGDGGKSDSIKAKGEIIGMHLREGYEGRQPLEFYQINSRVENLHSKNGRRIHPRKQISHASLPGVFMHLMLHASG